MCGSRPLPLAVTASTGTLAASVGVVLDRGEPLGDRGAELRVRRSEVRRRTRRGVERVGTPDEPRRPLESLADQRRTDDLTVAGDEAAVGPSEKATRPTPQIASGYSTPTTTVITNSMRSADRVARPT